MVASLLRILHSGIQNTRLMPPAKQPRITMYTKVFTRAGRFTTQFVRLDFDTKPTFGTAATLTIPRKGHLVSRLFLVTTMPDIKTQQIRAQTRCDVSGLTFLGPKFGWTNSLGHALLTEAAIEIGGSRMERLDGRLLEVLDEFYTPLEKVTLMNDLLPRKQNGFKVGVLGGLEDTENLFTTAVTPLPFWFSCGDPGAFLPIDAIQADATVLKVTFAPLANTYVSSQQRTPTQPNASVPGDSYVPIVNSPFYSAGGTTLVYGLTGNPTVGVNATVVPNIRMPETLQLGDTYILAEYVYLDKPEANRFRISDLQIPIPQHYPFDPVDTQTLPTIQIPLKVPNPTRNLFFYFQRFEAARYNAPFLATRDISGAGTGVPWWPDASGLNTMELGDLAPAFSTRDSEPIQSVQLIYEGRLVRYYSESPSIFRSLLPSFEMRKSPWVNRYYYTLAFGLAHGLLPPSVPSGEANLDKILSIDLQFSLTPNTGSINPNAVQRYFVYVWAETYNILRVYGGRAGLMFAY
jgi:hypothetical protein